MTLQHPSTDFGLGTEEEIWSGSPSQWSNALPLLLCLLVIPIPWALYRLLATKTTRFTLTNQRLKMESGIFSKSMDTLELYRIQDLSLHRTFLQRIVGLGSIHLNTSDTTTPVVTLDHLAQATTLYEHIRANVERLRRTRRVTELDLQDVGH